jgi:hypothetical protein
MMSDDLASIADRLAGYGLRGCAMEPEVAALVASALLEAALQVAALEALPFVVVPADER